MEDVKKRRTAQAKLVTRRVTTLLNGINCEVPKDEIEEKINNLKSAVGQLGLIQDEIMVLLDGEDDRTVVETQENWYNSYNKKVIFAIKEAKSYILRISPPTAPSLPAAHIKLKRLEIPKFDSDPKKFMKWKEIFERFTKGLDETTKYDYLLNCTLGEAQNYVSNRNDYDAAMAKLNEKYGNVHTLIGQLIDEIKMLPVTRKGDFKSFEHLSLRIQDFHDRLVLMGRERDVENSYILKEIESKLNVDDFQRWLESQGNQVDERSVNFF